MHYNFYYVILRVIIYLNLYRFIVKTTLQIEKIIINSTIPAKSQPSLKIRFLKLNSSLRLEYKVSKLYIYEISMRFSIYSYKIHHTSLRFTKVRNSQKWMKT